jgi:hypothetical protein
MSQSNQHAITRIRTTSLPKPAPITPRANPSKVLPESSQSRFDSAFDAIFGKSTVIHS